MNVSLKRGDGFRRDRARESDEQLPLFAPDVQLEQIGKLRQRSAKRRFRLRARDRVAHRLHLSMIGAQCVDHRTLMRSGRMRGSQHGKQDLLLDCEMSAQMVAKKVERLCSSRRGRACRRRRRHWTGRSGVMESKGQGERLLMIVRERNQRFVTTGHRAATVAWQAARGKCVRPHLRVRLPSARVLRSSIILVAAWVLVATAPHNAVAVTPCDLRYPSDASISWACQRVPKGGSLESMFGERWQDVARFNRMDRRHAYPGMRIRVPTDLATITSFTPMPSRYEAAAAEAKFILIDLSEQFVGAYEYGTLVFSAPVATGRRSHPTPTGEFRVTAFDRAHRSSLYKVEGTDRPYPMHFGLRFLTTRRGVTFWIHGRDMPGYPASHGCVGLSDEEMQRDVYGNPKEPRLDDARRLYEWVIGATPDPGTKQEIAGPRVLVSALCPRPTGDAPSPR